MAGGRPSKYKAEFAKQAEKLAKLGATDMEVADFFAVDVRTVYRWKTENEKFCQALKAGKNEADERVERSLFQRAVGYEQDEVKIFMPANAAEPVYAPYRAKITPDTTAAIFWLKNRRPDEWREKTQTELTGPNGGPIQSEARIDASGLTIDQLRALASIPVQPGGRTGGAAGAGKAQPGRLRVHGGHSHRAADAGER